MTQRTGELIPSKVLGRNLRVGDRMEIWTPTMLATIMSLEPYNGPLAKHFKNGAQLAAFGLGDSVRGMTIDNGDTYRVVSRLPEPDKIGGYVLYCPIDRAFRTAAGFSTDKLQHAEIFMTHDAAVRKHQLGDVIQPLSHVLFVVNQ